MAVLVTASITCDNQDHSIDILSNKIDILVNLTHNKSGNIETNLQLLTTQMTTIQHKIKELKGKKEEFQDKIEQFKLTIKSLVQAFKNLTSKDPNAPPDNCNQVLYPLLRSCQEIKA